VMFADTEYIEAGLVGKLHLSEQIAEACRGIERETCRWVRNRRRKAVDTDLHWVYLHFLLRCG
jgi:hypothetical protein